MTSPSAHRPDDLEAARFRSRMARVTTDRTGPRRRPAQEDESRGVRLGWKAWLLIDVVIVAGAVAVAGVWPPLQACRAQANSVGFYAGETVGACVRRGVSERLTNADQHIKMLLRGSGH